VSTLKKLFGLPLLILFTESELLDGWMRVTTLRLDGETIDLYRAIRSRIFHATFLSLGLFLGLAVQSTAIDNDASTTETNNAIRVPILCFFSRVRMFLTPIYTPLDDEPGDFGNFLNQRAQECRHVGANRKIRALPGPHGQKIRTARRLRRDRKISDESSLQWVRQNFRSRSVQFVHQSVVDSPCEPSREALCQRGVSSFSFQQSFAMKAAGAGSLARQEYRSHLHGLCAESQRSDYSSRISYTARGDHWHIDDVHHLRDERQRARERILRCPEE